MAAITSLDFGKMTGKKLHSAGIYPVKGFIAIGSRQAASRPRAQSPLTRAAIPSHLEIAIQGMAVKHLDASSKAGLKTCSSQLQLYGQT